MSSSINTLAGAISAGRGLARANRWRVSVGGALFNVVSGADGFVLAESVTLPGRTIATSEFSTNRESLKAAYSFIDDPVNITFLLTNNYIIKRFFDQWMEQIIDPKTYKLGYKTDYASTISISQLDQNDIPIYTVELLNAYPIAQASSELSNTAENTISRLTVTFAYDKYKTL